eukprot:gene23806-9369_t
MVTSPRTKADGKPALPTDFEETTWAKIQDAINAVHCKRPVTCSLEELYNAVQDMCMHKMSERLYQRLQQECNTHISAQILSLRNHPQLDSVLFLHRVDAVWQDYCQQMLTIRLIFLYLDRTHVISNTKTKSLFDMGLILFRKHLAAQPEVESRTVEGILALVERERKGEAIDRQLLKSLVRMFSNLGTYPETVQVPFLEQSESFFNAEGKRLMLGLDVPTYLQHCESESFFNAEGKRLMLGLDVPTYLQHCERRLSEEFERCVNYLDSATRKPLIAAVERQLIATHTAALLEKGYTTLMDAHRVEDLARLYNLSVRVNALESLRNAFKDYIRVTGLRLVKDEEKDKDMVTSLLDFKARLDEVLEKSMQKSESFANALKEAFEKFINQRQNKPAELIAKFKMPGKDVFQAFYKKDLAKRLLLGKSALGKDVFQAFYKKDLAKRLLLGKSASVDAEKSMMSKLKAESASVDSEKSMMSKLKAEFTNKLEGMFKDIDLSTDVMAAFRQHQETATLKIPQGLDMSVSVLTSGYWPTYPVMEAKLTQELESSQEVFKDFYLKKYSGRRLVWRASLGTSELGSSQEVFYLKKYSGRRLEGTPLGTCELESSQEVFKDFYLMKYSGRRLCGAPPSEPACCELGSSQEVFKDFYLMKYSGRRLYGMPPSEPELESSQEVFKDFYLKKYSGRRLVWHASLGTCVLKAQFPRGSKELSVSLFQSIVLMLFNGTDSLSLSEIATQSGIEDKELRRTLQSLACGKSNELSVSLFQSIVLMLFNGTDSLSLLEIATQSGIEDKELRRTLQSLAWGKICVLVEEPKSRDVEDADVFKFALQIRVLAKEPKSRDIEDADVFKFNICVVAKEPKSRDIEDADVFKFNIRVLVKEPKSRDVEDADVFKFNVIQDRQYQIDAAIVRIMKTRKQLSHKLLVSEAQQQLKLPLTQSDIKKRIESLIEREYVARDASDTNLQAGIFGYKLSVPATSWQQLRLQATRHPRSLVS